MTDSEWVKRTKNPTKRKIRKGLEICGFVVALLIVAAILFVLGCVVVTYPIQSAFVAVCFAAFVFAAWIDDDA
jgi:uncharacterized membrane protein